MKTDGEHPVADVKAALEGARAILVERFSEHADLTGSLREAMWSRGQIKASVRDGKKTEGAKFADYFDFSEPYEKLPSHRILALLRGEKEEMLSLDFGDGEDPESKEPTQYENRIAATFGISRKGRPARRVPVGLRALGVAHPDQDRARARLRMRLWQQAEKEAVRVFAANLRDLLLAAPPAAAPRSGSIPASAPASKSR